MMGWGWVAICILMLLCTTRLTDNKWHICVHTYVRIVNFYTMGYINLNSYRYSWFLKLERNRAERRARKYWLCPLGHRSGELVLRRTFYGDHDHVGLAVREARVQRQDQVDERVRPRVLHGAYDHTTPTSRPLRKSDWGKLFWRIMCFFTY